VPFQRITEVAEKRHIDLIIMGAHRHKGFQGLFRGALAKKIMRLAPCPVWIAPSSTSDTEAPCRNGPRRCLADSGIRLLRVLGRMEGA
jgi:hypothetical protein